MRSSSSAAKRTFNRRTRRHPSKGAGLQPAIVDVDSVRPGATLRALRHDQSQAIAAGKLVALVDKSARPDQHQHA